MVNFRLALVAVLGLIALNSSSCKKEADGKSSSRIKGVSEAADASVNENAQGADGAKIENFQGNGGTSILNQDAYLQGLPEPQWYKDNIPFLDIPDTTIQQIYYYRWSSYRRHVHYTNPATGYIITEFAHVPGYAGAFGAINAAAGHHIYEGRWLKTQRYLDDYELFWMRGAGRNPLSGVDTGGINSAHQYSFWAADAYYNRYLVNGDKAFITNLLPDLIKQYDEWNVNFDAGRKLYTQTPVWDAMENTISSSQTNDPYHGGTGFRPTINAYQFADAKAISAIATLTGNAQTIADFNDRALSIKTSVQTTLWSPQSEFFVHMMTNNAKQAYPFPEGTLFDGREEMGFVPWAFNLPDDKYAVAWKQLMDPQGFYGAYGPTTAERRHPQFMLKAEENCCYWNGPVWPFSTSHTLMGLANLLNGSPQAFITAADYYKVLKNYALSQYKDGRPYVAEGHHPDQDKWIYNSSNHSEHYNHSTFNDLVITGLIGLRPRGDDTFVVNPLVPADWNYFLLENVLYHGHQMTILWDKDGTRYSLGAGLRIFEDGHEIASSPTLKHLEAAMHPPRDLVVPERLENLAANPTRTGFPSPIASYTNAADNAWEALDGDIWFDDIPDSRWTAYTSPNDQDSFGVDFGASQTVKEVRIYIYDDGGGVQPPSSYKIQYLNGSTWTDVAHDVRIPAQPRGRDVNIVSFDPVATTQIRALFTHAKGTRTGITEFEVWGAK